MEELELTLLDSDSSFYHETKIVFLIILRWRTWRWIIIVCSSWFAYLFILFVTPFLFAHIAWTFNLDVSLFTTSKTSVFCRIKFINILSIVSVWWLVFVLVVLHINCAFMDNFKDVPQLLCKSTFWDPEKLIGILGRRDDIFSNTVILSLFSFTLSPLGPWFLNENIIFFNFRNKRAIYNSILDSSINWFNKDFHSNLP